jgi:hypothetical protein
LKALPPTQTQRKEDKTMNTQTIPSKIRKECLCEILESFS